MKAIKTLFAAAALSLSFASIAAVEVNATPEGQSKIGTVSTSAASSLSALEDQLSDKADQLGAKSFRITSVAGNNAMHGTAEIYK